MSRTLTAAALAASLSVGLFFAGASSAHAAEDPATCTTPVVDNTAAQVLDVASVEAAVQEANATGADVFVRAFETTPTGTTDGYWQQSIKDCANWRNGNVENGVPKGNMIMVVFGMDRQSGVYFGSGYNDAIGNANANAIRADMNEQFRVGNFTDGVVTAIEELAVFTDPDYVAPEPTPPIVIDWAAVGMVILWVIAALVLLVLLVWTFFVVKRQRRRAYARYELAELKRTANTRVTSWEGSGEFTDVTFLTGGMPLPEKAQSLKYTEELQAVESRTREASIRNARYTKGESHDPTNRRLDMDEIDQAKYDYTSVLAVYDAADSTLLRLKSQAQEDARQYSFEGQAARAAVMRKSLTAMGGKLSDYDKLFATTVANRKHQRLSAELAKVEEAIVKQTDQLVTYERLTELDGELDELNEEFDRMRSAASTLSNPRGELESILQRGRSRLGGFSIDTKDEERQLDNLDGAALDGVLRKIKTSNSYERQMSIFESFERRVSSVVGKAQVRDDKYRAAQQEKKRQLARKSRRSSSYNSSSSNNGLLGAAIGGYVGASLGSSHRDSSPSYSPPAPSYDFGGGSGGSWGGGGGDFGGGSGGSW